MKLLIRFFPSVLFLIIAIVGNAQEVPEYTVQVGKFINPKPADFERLSELGFVYSTKRSDNHTDIFIGGFSSDEAANKVVGKLKGQGYGNAFVAKLNTEAGRSETVVQLATKTSGDKINWDYFMQAGPLYVLLNGKGIKILAGGFADLEAAKSRLPELKAMGFGDAFVKNVNNALLHQVTEFETGGIVKKPLIPLDFTEKEDLASKPGTAKPDSAPISYEDVTLILPKNKAGDKPPVLTAKGGGAVKAKKTASKEPAFDFRARLPEIRAKVKRTSALELQRVLKAEGTYKSSLDGYYGKGTRAGYDLALRTNRQMRKYAILAKYLPVPATDVHVGTVQRNIDNLWQDPETALNALKKSKAPIAKAYRAYFLYVTEGAGFEVNTLMNEAINEAFSRDVRASLPSFDPSSTYDYRDLGQLLSHLRYVHEVSNEGIAAPCWLFRRHPSAALKAFGEIDGLDSNLSMQTCGGFWEWQEVQLLHAIASDLSTTGHTSESKITNSQSELARLYLTPKQMGWKDRKALLDWNEAVWKGFDSWATRDPFLAEITVALKISYFQAQVLLEDFYMDEGFDEKESKGLALAALKALVGHHFDRFI